MDYIGKLYGKVGGKYFPLGQTTEDWDSLENKIKLLEIQVQAMQEENASLSAVISKNSLQSEALYLEMKSKLKQYEFLCKKCLTTHKMSVYAVAQLTSGNNLIFTCQCGEKIDLKKSDL